MRPTGSSRNSSLWTIRYLTKVFKKVFAISVQVHLIAKGYYAACYTYLSIYLDLSCGTKARPMKSCRTHKVRSQAMCIKCSQTQPLDRKRKSNNMECTHCQSIRVTAIVPFQSSIGQIGGCLSMLMRKLRVPSLTDST